MLRVLSSCIGKNKRLILFLLLQIVSIILIFYKDSFKRSYIEEILLNLDGYTQSKIFIIKEYINLNDENRRLASENKELLAKVSRFRNIQNRLNLDALQADRFSYKTAKIISNTINQTNNYLVIDKGTSNNVDVDMGVITTNGIVGLITKSTMNYSRVMSILNKNTLINARLKKNKYYGILTWDGEDPRIMVLSDIPKYVSINLGDTIETDNKSNIYPEGIPLGRVSNKEIDEESGNWNIFVELFLDLGNLQNVYIVDKLDKKDLIKINDSLNVL